MVRLWAIEMLHLVPPSPEGSLDPSGTVVRKPGINSLELLARHAVERPTATAVQDEQLSLTYGQLLAEVGAFASGLRSMGVQPGDRVAIRLPNSVGFVVAALGCLWAGAAFVPLAVDDPPIRLGRILTESRPVILLASAGALPPPLDGIAGLSIATVEEVLARSGPAPPAEDDPERDAYIIFTSGTTGAPKGVRIPERAFALAIHSVANIVGIGPDTRSLCVSPFHFDGSYGTLFPTLIAGGCVTIPRRERACFSYVRSSAPSWTAALPTPAVLPHISEWCWLRPMSPASGEAS